MTLPKIDVPTYTVDLPSTGKSITYRPFLVKEQKQLLIAQNGDALQQRQAVVDLITACTHGQVTDKNPGYDIDFMFLQIRARSVGENIDLILTCSKCNHDTEAQLDITTVKVANAGNQKAAIRLGGDLYVELADPSAWDLTELQETNTAEAMIKLIASSIVKIFKGNEVYDAREYTQTDLIEFVENLNPQSLTALEQYFENLPVLRHEMAFTCSECGTENKAVLEGLQSFFV